MFAQFSTAGIKFKRSEAICWRAWNCGRHARESITGK
jgi:hypothetical protein